MRHGDSRGQLIALEQNMPPELFSIENIFFK